MEGRREYSPPPPKKNARQPVPRRDLTQECLVLIAVVSSDRFTSSLPDTSKYTGRLLSLDMASVGGSSSKASYLRPSSSPPSCLLLGDGVPRKHS